MIPSKNGVALYLLYRDAKGKAWYNMFMKK